MNNKIKIDFTPLAIALDSFTVSTEEAIKNLSRLNITMCDHSSDVTILHPEEGHKLVPMICSSCGGGLNDAMACKMCGTRFMLL